MTTGTELSSTGPFTQRGTTSFAAAGNDPCNAPVFGSSSAHDSEFSLSFALPGLLPSAMTDPSGAHLTCQPRAIGNNFGAASSLAFGARMSAGILITPGCATPRCVVIPLVAN